MSRVAVAWRRVRFAVLASGFAVLACLGWDAWVGLMRTQPLGIDFLPMWAAGREAFSHPDRVYNVIRLTRFEHPLLEGFHGPRPFVYPPTALLLFALVAALPFALANGLWTLAGVGLILAAVSPRLPSQRWLASFAMLASPAAVLVMVTGQVTFLIAALAVSALGRLENRPIVAGVLLGIAGVLKPQAMALAPVALVASRQWRAMAGAAICAGVASAVATLVFGWGAWLGWAHALASFQRWVMATPALQRGMITPSALGLSLRLDPGGYDVWRLAFALGAVVMVWAVFRRTDDLARRLAALLGGALFVTPYAMHYDAALLAPSAALMLTTRHSPGAWIVALIAGAVLCFAAVPHWGAAAVTAFTLFAAFTPASAFGGEWRRAEFSGAGPPAAQPEGAAAR